MRSLVILALSTLVLSGCTGIPADAAGTGDFVTATVTITDATGATLLETTQIQFAMLSGNSGLGFDFERRLMGAKAGSSFDYQVSKALDYSEKARVDRLFEPIPLLADIGRAQFEGAFGPAETGMEFAPEFSFYNYRIEAVTEDTVTYRILPVDGQTNDVPQVGAVLVTHLDEAADQMVQSLDPVVGATFQVAPPSPFNPSTPLGLAAGAYVTLGATASQIEYGFANTLYPQLLGAEAHFQVTIDDVQQGPSVQEIPADGNIGARNSPVLDGRADTESDFGPFLDFPAQDEPADDSDGPTH